MLRVFFALYLMVCSLFVWAEAESECFGNPNNGRLHNGWQLPASGKNFHAYSSLGVVAGRNFVHSKVYRIVLEAYEILQKTNPKIMYVYGETGFKDGGLFRPHKSHRNGLSVDFFVPVVDSKGVPAELDIGINNKLGYNLEFNSSGQLGDLSIDFESILMHSLRLQRINTAVLKWLSLSLAIRHCCWQHQRGLRLRIRSDSLCKSPGLGTMNIITSILGFLVQRLIANKNCLFAKVVRF